MAHFIAILLAYIIDTIVGDPKTWPHPVKAFGKLIALLEMRLNKNKKSGGLAMVIIVILIVGIVGLTLVYLAYQINVYVGIIIESVLIATTIAQKSLKDAAMDVYRPLQEKKLPQARQALAYIVGRDTDNLDEAEISRATIETVAENTSDGITAPLFWAIIGGAPLALIYRAINTCDSMVGYQNERYSEFGWASARLDDLVNWLPARITGFIMIFCKKPEFKLKQSRIQLLQKEAKNHASPNSAWTEAAVAILLGIQLGGENYYQGKLRLTKTIGHKNRALEMADILKTIQLMYVSVIVFLLIYGIGVGIYVLA